jgi:threonine dehydrogenase-like Zn-dependent dehydrogenase
VVALSRRPSALRAARDCGADEACCLENPRRAVERIRELTGGAGCERVIEATGQAAPLDLAGELCAVRGRLIVAGYHQDGPRQINLQLWNWRGLDVINAHERDPAVYVRGMRQAIAEVARRQLEPTQLYTHTFRLDELPRAFEAAQRRPEGFLKSLILIDDLN